MTRAWIALAALLAGVASAEEARDHPAPPAIRVVGEGRVTVKPDQAQLDVGVTTQAESAQAAGTQNARKVDAVLAAVKKTAGAGADIKTVGYSLSANYRYPKEGGQPAVTGYTASNVVQIRTGDLDQVGKLVDAATQAGATNVQRLEFTLRDEHAVRAQALGEAATRARAKADAIASALGLKVVRVLRVDEQGGPLPRPVMERAPRALAETAAVPTPVEPGTIDVQGNVTLEVEVQ